MGTGTTGHPWDNPQIGQIRFAGTTATLKGALLQCKSAITGDGDRRRLDAEEYARREQEIRRLHTEGYSVREIARALDCPRTTVHRSLTRVQKPLERELAAVLARHDGELAAEDVQTPADVERLGGLERYRLRHQPTELGRAERATVLAEREAQRQRFAAEQADAIVAVGYQRAWDEHTRIPVTDGHSWREHCDAALSDDSGTDRDDDWVGPLYFCVIAALISSRLWDAATGQPVGQPMGDQKYVVSDVAFSPDGTRIASASADRTLRLWDTHTEQPVGQPMTGHTDYLNSVAFSPDGKRIASGGDDKTIRLWPGYADTTTLCAKLTANMSHQQWRDWVSPDIDYIKVCPDLPVAPD